MNKEGYIKRVDELLTESISLSYKEKLNVRKNYDRLSFSQLEELIKIFEEEKKAFEKLSKQFPNEVRKLRESKRRSGLGLSSITFEVESNSNGLDFEQLSILNQNLGLLIDKLFLKSDIKVLQVKTGSIEEIIGGNLSQIITVCGLLFASAKGILHLIKERKAIKKTDYENQLLQLNINTKKSDLEKEKRKKINIEKLLVNKPQVLYKILDRFDADFIEYVLQNFDTNPFDEINPNNVEDILSLTDIIAEEFPVKNISIEKIEGKSDT